MKVRSADLYRLIEESWDRLHDDYNENFKSMNQNFFDKQEVSKYKFMSGPFVNKIFQITNIQHNKIKILIGDLKTTINKKEFLFSRI